jgi:tetratricopeptide (TPR) repeat protein
MQILSLLALSVLGNDTTTAPSPAELHIRRALSAIEAQPNRAAPYAQLAFGFSRRARETADPTFYRRAHEAIEVALALDPKDFEARKQEAWALLGEHRFAEAAALAAELNKEAPDDVLVYGFLVDAHVELGNYATAEEACQWMLDLRPGNVPGLTRAAYLRELYGDPEGAVELLGEAFHGIPATEPEDQAWILTHMAELRRDTGHADVARGLVERALGLFPGYHYALAELARIELGAGRAAEAVLLLRRRWEAAPHPENLLDLARALRAAGEEGEARELFARFEEEARQESGGLDNANRELVHYLVDDVEGRAAEALELARRELERRRDVFTRDAFAWALFAAGRRDEARAEIEAVLAVGLREPLVLYHAGAILSDCSELARARALLTDSLARDPRSPVAGKASALLAALPGEGAAQR